MYEKLKCNLSKDVCISFSACFVVFCYYLITPSIWSSLLIFITEKHFNINTLYKLLSLNNPMREWLQKIFVYSPSYYFFCLFSFCFNFVIFHEALLLLHCLTLFIQLIFFYTPWNITNPKVFWCFQRDIERDQWHKKG